jgi:hypothetical protein
MEKIILRDTIIGARNLRTIITTIFLFFAGTGFFLAGLSSYLGINLLFVTSTKNIIFLPQGITMMFYGSLALGISFYLFFTILWNVGSGYNEFSQEEQLIRIVRLGFPGKNKTLFLSYEFFNVKALKVIVKQGLNPRSNLILVLKDKRQIPLFPAQFLLDPGIIEQKGLTLSKLLNVPLENVRI